MSTDRMPKRARRILHQTGKGSVDAKRRGDPRHPRFRVEDWPFYLIARTNARYVLDMEHVLKKVGMDPARWRTLMLLHEKSPSSIGEIVERAVMRISTMTRVAQRLHREGYVRLAARAGDARVTELHITRKGREAVVDVRRVASDIYRQAFGDFSAAEIERLLDMLRRVFANLQLASLSEHGGSGRRLQGARRGPRTERRKAR
jgi:DNA-binding MarR family transcriptional regulator